MDNNIKDAIVLFDDEDNNQQTESGFVKNIIAAIGNAVSNDKSKNMRAQAQRDAECLAFNSGADFQEEMTLRQYIDLEVQKMEFKYNLTTINRSHFYIKNDNNDIDNFELINIK